MNRQPEERTIDQIPPKEAKSSPTRRARAKRKAHPTDKQKDENSRLQKELVARLSRLRTTSRDIARIYVSKVESEIVKLTEAVGSRGGSKKKRWKTSVLEEMNKVLDDLNIKPEKGRRKDLKRIELVLEALPGFLSRKK